MSKYLVGAYSRVGSRSQITSELHAEEFRVAGSVRELCAAMRLMAERNGWRQFTVELLDDGRTGVPLQ